MNIKFKRWITLFSQTGSEIVELSNLLGRFPDLILTNQKRDTVLIREELLDKNIVFMKDTSIETYKQYLQQDDLITLHGFLKIIPKDIVEVFTIYNGHPGLITVYPDLKGKDPQLVAYKKQYDLVGSVVHRCTELVDNGPICTEARTFIITGSNIEVYYSTLKNTSLESWKVFFKDFINSKADLLNKDSNE